MKVSRHLFPFRNLWARFTNVCVQSASMFPTTCSGRPFHTGTVLGKNDLAHWCRAQWPEEVLPVGTWSACDTALALVVRVVRCLGGSWDLMSSGSFPLCILWRSPRPEMRRRCASRESSWDFLVFWANDPLCALLYGVQFSQLSLSSRHPGRQLGHTLPALEQRPWYTSWFNYSDF